MDKLLLKKELITLLLTGFLITIPIPAAAQFDTYPTYAEYIVMMDQFQQDHPDLCKIEEFGTTVKGRKLLAAKITDNVATKEKEPQFFYMSTIHGNEPGGYVLMLRLIDHLLTNYGTDEQVTRLVDSIEIWINPLANPDGTYKKSDTIIAGSSVGQNANNVDLDRDFPTPVGTDTCTQPETKAFIDLFTREHFIMSADLHGGAELAIYPWGYKQDHTADKEWWEYVARQYADTAQAYSPSTYFQTQGGVANQFLWYQVRGHFGDYVLYFHHCRNLTLELSNQKLLTPSKLNEHWDYNYRSLLNYMEQVLFGIRGTVTDWTTDPLEVLVEVDSHDKDSSHVYSTESFGDYYRPIYQGNYDVTYTSEHYPPKTISNIHVENGTATVVDVVFTASGITTSEKNSSSGISITTRGNFLQISGSCINQKNNLECALYSVSGKKLFAIGAEIDHQTNMAILDIRKGNGKTLSDGCYIFQVYSGSTLLTKRILMYH